MQSLYRSKSKRSVRLWSGIVEAWVANARSAEGGRRGLAIRREHRGVPPERASSICPCRNIGAKRRAESERLILAHGKTADDDEKQNRRQEPPDVRARVCKNAARDDGEHIFLVIGKQ